MDERKYSIWSNHSMYPEFFDEIRINWANELSKQRGPSLKDDVFFKVKLIFYILVKVNHEFTQNFHFIFRNGTCNDRGEVVVCFIMHMEKNRFASKMR